MTSKAELIDKIRDGQPRVHATGFAQLYIAPNTRLHVWTDWLLKNAPDVRQLAFFHDHRYAIRSTVIGGALHDQMVDPVLNNAHGRWRMWEVRPAHEGEPEKPHLIEGPFYDVTLRTPRIIVADQWYEIPLRAFHSTRAIGDTVTIMEKVGEEASWARLVVPCGDFDPIHSLSRQPPVERVKQEMIRAVAGVVI